MADKPELSDNTPKTPVADANSPQKTVKPPPLAKEVGGPPGPEPTRYGDWAYKGRVTDF